MSTLENRLSRLIAQSGIQATDEQQAKLLGYVEMLNKWNKAYNLTSVREPSEMLVKHIMDSIVVSDEISGERFIDVGTGPGLPGIPLAIMNPDKQFVLLDSLGKRIRFIKQVLHELGIHNVEAIQSRVEEYRPDHGFDGVLSRAFASMRDMVEWCHHLPTSNGVFYALKGQVTQQEQSELPEWCSVISVKALEVPELEGERHLVILGRN